jgi:hypothetical protein
VQIWTVDVDANQYDFAYRMASNHQNSVGAMVYDDKGGVNNPNAYAKKPPAKK